MKTSKVSVTVRSAQDIALRKASKNSIPKKNAFFIEGGGTKGVFAIGILKYLFEDNKYFNLNDIGMVGGTSVGSLLAVALSIGYNKDDLISIAKIININDLIDSKYAFPLTMYRFITNGYLYEDIGRQNIIKQILELKINNIKEVLKKDISVYDLTFNDLKQLITLQPSTYTHLIMNAVDLSSKNQVFFTTLNNDSNNIKLYDAMLASSAIPFVFKPTYLYRDIKGIYNYDKSTDSKLSYFVDGGVSTNNPLDYFLFNPKQFDDYNIWLLKFTGDTKYVNINGSMSLLKQLTSYFLSADDDIKFNLIEKQYKINTINLNSKAGTLDLYTQEQILQFIDDVYNNCVNGILHFE